MLVCRFTSRRSTIFRQLLRLYSIKVSPLKKHSLYAQILRRDASPSISKAAPRAGLFSDGGCKPIQLQTSFRSVDKHPPSLVASKASAPENGNHLRHCPMEEDGFSDGSLGFKAEGKEALAVDGFTCPPLKAGGTYGDVLQPQRSTYQAKCSDGDDACGDAQPLFSRKTEISKSEGHHSQAGGKRRQASKVKSCNACISTDNTTEVGSLKVGHSEKFTCSALEVGNEHELSSKRSLCTTETNAGNVEIIPCHELTAKNVGKEQCAIKHAQAKQRGEQHANALVAQTSSQSLQKLLSPKSMEVYSADERRGIKDEFMQDRKVKTEMLQSASVPFDRVRELRNVKSFVSSSPAKLATLIEVLTEFLGSREMACRTLTHSPGIFSQPLSQVQLRLQLLDKFHVDRKTCWVAGVSKQTMELDVEVLEKVLIFLEDLGLSVEARNGIIRKHPTILRQSVEQFLRPIVDFLKSLGTSKRRLLRLLEVKSCLLCSPLERILLPRHSFFRKLGLSDAAFVAYLGVSFDFDMDLFYMRYRFLRERGFSEEMISKLVRAEPRIFLLTPQSLKRNLDYLLHEANRDLSEVVRFPACLVCSLEKRIIPRFMILRELQLSGPCRLSGILRPNHSLFLKRFKPCGSTKCQL